MAPPSMASIIFKPQEAVFKAIGEVTVGVSLCTYSQRINLFFRFTTTPASLSFGNWRVRRTTFLSVRKKELEIQTKSSSSKSPATHSTTRSRRKTKITRSFLSTGELFFNYTDSSFVSFQARGRRSKRRKNFEQRSYYDRQVCVFLSTGCVNSLLIK